MPASEKRPLDETGDKPTTIYDVAQAAGVSTASVSRVVNGVGKVSSAVHARVTAAIAQLHFCPNTSAVVMGRAAGGIAKNRGTAAGNTG